MRNPVYEPHGFWDASLSLVLTDYIIWMYRLFKLTIFIIIIKDCNINL